MSNTIIAAYWMIGTMFFLSMMAISGRELGGDLDTFEIMTYRSLIGIMIVLFFIIYNKSHFEINIKRLKLHFIRNIFHFTGQNLWFFAVIYIPLSQLFAFEFTCLMCSILCLFYCVRFSMYSQLGLAQAQPIHSSSIHVF